VHAWKVSISSHHYEQATLAKVNRIGIVRMLRADELVSFVAPRLLLMGLRKSLNQSEGSGSMLSGRMLSRAADLRYPRARHETSAFGGRR
jgi:hypothetical protein